jgi:hypothetical protein
MADFINIPNKEHDPFATKIDSGLYDRDEEAKVLKDDPKLVDGKALFEKMLASSMFACDVAAANTHRKVYDVWEQDGVYFIQTHQGTQSVKGYVFSLEKALIKLSRSRGVSILGLFKRVKKLFSISLQKLQIFIESLRGK